jgi:hypothetical protein
LQFSQPSQLSIMTGAIFSFNEMLVLCTCVLCICFLALLIAGCMVLWCMALCCCCYYYMAGCWWLAATTTWEAVNYFVCVCNSKILGGGVSNRFLNCTPSGVVAISVFKMINYLRLSSCRTNQQPRSYQKIEGPAWSPTSYSNSMSTLRDTRDALSDITNIAGMISHCIYSTLGVSCWFPTHVQTRTI